MISKSKKNNLFQSSCLFLAISVFILVWFSYPHEFSSSDPGAYSYHSYLITENHFLENSTGHPFWQRVGVLFPTAAFYYLFGISERVTNLWPLCCAIIIIISIWTVMSDTRSKLISLILCLTSIPLFQASTALYPDIVATAFMSASCVFLYYRTKVLERSVSKSLYPVFAVVLLFIAFLSKLSAYWVIPLWLIALSGDLVKKDYCLIRKFYLPSILTGVVFLVAYLFICHLIWDDPLIRFAGIQKISGQHLWASGGDLTKLFKRLTFGPAYLFLRGYNITIVYALLAFFTFFRKIKFWAYYTAITIIFYWFGTASFTNIEPLPIRFRMTLPSLPGIYILAAYFASNVRLANIAEKKSKIISVILVLLMATIPYYNYLKTWKEKELAEAKTMNILKRDVFADSDRKYLLLCSDKRSSTSLSFYFGYEYPENLEVVHVSKLTDRHLKENAIFYVYVNTKRSSFLEQTRNIQSFDDQIRRLSLKLLFSSDQVFLYLSTNKEDLLPLLSVKTSHCK